MGGFWSRLRGARPPQAQGPTPKVISGECQIEAAWHAIIGDPISPDVDPSVHEGVLRVARFRAKGGRPAAEFTLCHSHALAFVRIEMMGGNIL